ncbi:MAG: prepilin peptidase [Desulfobacterales bacterium]|jgi:leader peptidase (prepilin peptidase)/N-methyltransferase|nr:prepilin peptidase [Desulfobacterales bacterium]
MEWVAFVFGLIVGSFLNVCIHRLPLSQSVVHPRSACPGCSRPIRAYDNIPVVSYLALRGRCRDCGMRIPWRYPLVELLSGAFAALAVVKFGLSGQAAVVYLLVAALLVVTFIDIDHRIIPDVISLPGIPIGLAASFGLSGVSPLQSLIGILAGGGSLFLVAWGYQLATGREGMGGGDIKLLAMIGAFFGWPGVLFTVFTASLTGTLAGLAVILRQRGDMKLAVPFGPFLAIGAIGYAFIGPETLAWYLKWMRP